MTQTSELSARRMSHPPGNPSQWLIVLAASAGGIQAMRVILAALPADLPASIVLVQHRPPGGDVTLADLFAHGTRWPVRVATQGERIHGGRVYLARADSHLTITPDPAFLYRDGTKINFLRSSANPLFASAADVYGRHVIGIVLSGTGQDATNGVQAVRANGGIVIAQDQRTSAHWGMPGAAVASGAVDYVLPLEAIAPAIVELVRGLPVVKGA